jgi:2-methylcitrate dehydratase PrpD
MGSQIEELATFVANASWDDVPATVRDRAKLTLLDTIGVMLAGSMRPEVRRLRGSLAPSGGAGATILGPGMQPSDPRTAALLNAIAGRSVELCDGLRGLQPSVQIVPGILALGEMRSCSGRDLLMAFLVGYEVAGRLGSGFTPRAFAHPNGQISLLACAAAGARLYGLDAAGISLAMRIATTMLMTPSYNNTVAGGTTLNLPAGMSATAAVLAPELAVAGFHAQSDAIEEALDHMVGAGFDPTKITDGLGDGWQISGNYFRFYACCNPIHPALDCLADAMRDLRATWQDVGAIDVETYAFASVMRNAEPPNYFASKYSLPHAAAVLLVRGGLGFAELDDSALTDGTIAALRQCVHVREDPAMTARGALVRPARVSVTLKDGRSASAERDMSRRDFEQPDPEPDVRRKFRALAETVLTAGGIDAVEKAVDGAEAWSSVGDLVTMLRQFAET